MSPGRYYQKAALATLKHTTVYDNAVIGSKPNVFYYAPNLFSQMDDDHSQFADWLDDINDVLMNGTDNYEEIMYNGMPYVLDPKLWQMQLQVRLFDGQSQLLLDRKISNLYFNQPYPNHAYLCAYLKDGNRRYNGVTIALPELALGNYQLELVEDYVLDQAGYSNHPDLDPAHFTRKIIIPISVDKAAHDVIWTPANKDKDTQWQLTKFGYNLAQYEMTHTDPRVNDLIERYLNDDKGMSEIGPQSIIMPRMAMPTLRFDVIYGMFNEYAGSGSELFKNFERQLGHSGYELKPEYKTAIKNLKGVLDQHHGAVSFLAANLNAEYKSDDPKLQRVFNHNQLGSSLTTLPMYLINNPSSVITKHTLVKPFALDNPHNSHYDFEEYVPKFILPGVAKQTV